MTIAFALAAVLIQSQAPPRDTRRPPAIAGATIAGVVTTDDAEPRPLRRARVTITGPPFPREMSVMTADDGSFEFDGLPAGSFEVSARKEAYLPMNYGATRTGRPGLALPISAGETRRIVLRLPRGAVITGRILDANNQPAQGVGVTAFARRMAFGMVMYRTSGSMALPTDDRGVYRIFGLPAGEYLIAVDPQWSERIGTPARIGRTFTPARVFYSATVDPSQADRIAVRAGDERTGVDIQLQYVPIASVSGTVTAAAGWTSAEVALTSAEPSFFISTPSMTVDASGRFSFPNVRPGRYRVVARASGPAGVQTAEAEVTLNGDDVENFVLPLQPAPSINGLIVFRGDAPPPVFGTSRVTPPLAPMLTSRVDIAPEMQVDGGRFTIQGLAPGTYQLGSGMQGVRWPIGQWWLQSLSVNRTELLDSPLDLHQTIDGAVAIFADRASEVSGRVTTDAGLIASGTFVVVFSSERSAWYPGSRRVEALSTDPEGHYAIRNLPPGSYRVAAAPDLEFGEWYDTAVLERLLATAATLTIDGAEKKIVDLKIARRP